MSFWIDVVNTKESRTLDLIEVEQGYHMMEVDALIDGKNKNIVMEVTFVYWRICFVDAYSSDPRRAGPWLRQVVVKLSRQHSCLLAAWMNSVYARISNLV
jgi:hypothetical protein